MKKFLKKLSIPILILITSNSTFAFECNYLYENSIEKDIESHSLQQAKSKRLNIMPAFQNTYIYTAESHEGYKTTISSLEMFKLFDAFTCSKYNYWYEKYRHSTQAFRYAIAYKDKYDKCYNKKIAMAFARCVAVGIDTDKANKIADEISKYPRLGESFDDIDRYIFSKYGINIKQMLSMYDQYYLKKTILSENDDIFADIYATLKIINTELTPTINEEFIIALCLKYLDNFKLDPKRQCLIINSYLSLIPKLKECYAKIQQDEKESLSIDDISKAIVLINKYNNCYNNDNGDFLSNIKKYLSLIKTHSGYECEYLNRYYLYIAQGMSSSEANQRISEELSQK